MGLGQIKQGNSSFFLPNLMIFQSGAWQDEYYKTLKNHQIYATNLTLNDEKPCSTFRKP